MKRSKKKKNTENCKKEKSQKRVKDDFVKRAKSKLQATRKSNKNGMGKEK